MDLGTFLHYDISIYAILYLGMLFVLILLRREIYSVSSKLILNIVGINILILILEMFSWVIDGTPGELYFYLSYFVNTLLYISVGLIVAYWMSYIDFVVFRSKERLVKRHYFLWISLFTTVMAIVNLFVPILFFVNSENLYVRGSFFFLYYLVFVFVFVYSIIVTVYKKDLEEIRDVLWTVYSFMGIVLIAGLIQALNHGVLLQWPTMGLATSIVYIFLETTSHNRDFVTKLYTRRKADQYIRHLKDEHKPFAVIMIDLDDYKEINDEYGHIVGDKALYVFANALQKAYKTEGMVSRFGGDEFLIVLVDVDETYITEKRQLVSEYLSIEMEKFPFDDIKFSYGYAFDQKGKSVEELVVKADDAMYENKAENKNYKRRKTD